MDDGVLQVGIGIRLQREVAGNDLLNILADEQLAEVLQVGQAAQEQNALDQLVGMLHLVDRFFALLLGELRKTPVGQHAGMEEVLVDRRELILEHDVEPADGFGVAGDASVGGRAWRYSAACSRRGASARSSIFSIVSWHLPQFFLTLQ